MDGIAASTGMRCTHHIPRALSSRKGGRHNMPRHMLCHVVSATSARSESSVPHLAGALLLTARRCVPSAVAPERHRQRVLGCTDPRRRPPARANRAQKQRQPRRLSAKKCTPMRHFGSQLQAPLSASAGRSPCRRRRRRTSLHGCTSQPREHRRLRALQAVVAEGFRSKLCRGRAVSKLAVQFLALGSTGIACCLQAPTPSRTT